MLKIYNKDGFFITSDDIRSFNIFKEDVEKVKAYLEENNVNYEYHADALAAFGQQEARFWIKYLIDESEGDIALTEEQLKEVEVCIIDEILNKSESVLDCAYLEDIAREMYEFVEKYHEDEQ